jgi:hypothetical protein
MKQLKPPIMYDDAVFISGPFVSGKAPPAVQRMALTSAAQDRSVSWSRSVG